MDDPHIDPAPLDQVAWAVLSGTYPLKALQGVLRSLNKAVIRKTRGDYFARSVPLDARSRSGRTLMAPARSVPTPSGIATQIAATAAGAGASGRGPFARRGAASSVSLAQRGA